VFFFFFLFIIGVLHIQGHNAKVCFQRATKDYQDDFPFPKLIVCLQ